MFTERNIKAAFKMLCEMYDEEDRWMMDASDDFFALEGISNYCMAKALEERMEDVFEYKAVSAANLLLLGLKFPLFYIFCCQSNPYPLVFQVSKTA